MKKSLKVLSAIAAVFALSATSCGEKTYKYAVVTDVGSLMDGGFNQGTYEGVKAYAKANKESYKYYQPANGSDATDNDRIEAMRTAIANGAEVIVTPGFLQFTAIDTVAKEHPEVKFVFVDGWAIGKENVTAIVYKEEESGFLAGYGAVMDGYTKLGGTFGGGGSNPACNRFAYGYVQGAQAAAKALGKTVDVKISYKYGSSFSASNELQTQVAGWYAAGTEVVFACGGSMVNSVIAAANETKSGKVIGVDVDQAKLSDRVLTSAVKGLSVSVEKVLGQIANGEWNSKLSDKAQNLGASDDATGLPTAKSSWRFSKWTVSEYEAVFNMIKSGTVKVSNVVLPDCDTVVFWGPVNLACSNVNVTLEK